MKSEAEEAAFVVIGGESNQSRGEIEEGRGEEEIVFHNPNRPALFDNEEPAVANRSEVVRRIQAAGDLLQLNPNRPAQNVR